MIGMYNKALSKDYKFAMKYFSQLPILQQRYKVVAFGYLSTAQIINNSFGD